tara:strand:+ start:425 stop:682 length:258 start_codon:yes stop_codon:yes gene_type:complete
MNKILINTSIFFIKAYQYILSPLLFNRCRFIPSCSDYFIECLKEHGFFKGSLYGFKRILKCHPIKTLGGSSGLDIVPKKGSKNNG